MKKSILIKGVDIDVWKQARIEALKLGETMGEYVAGALEFRLRHDGHIKFSTTSLGNERIIESGRLEQQDNNV